MKIVISQGLDLSLQGSPKESGVYSKILPDSVSVDLRPYEALPLKVMVHPGDEVLPGTPIAEYKNFPGTCITSHIEGTVTEIRRGEKRVLLDVLIKPTKPQSDPQKDAPSYDLYALSQRELLDLFKREGLFALFKQRPLDIPALPTQTPRDVFINLADNRPFVPTPEKHLKIFPSKEIGFFTFTTGVRAIAKLFGLHPHIVFRDHTPLPTHDLTPFAHLHTITGPFPSGSPSVHIQNIAPITHEKDLVFTISFSEVLSIGHFFLKGCVQREQILALAGTGLTPEFRKHVITTKGSSFSSLFSSNNIEKNSSLISGDPLTGRLCQEDHPHLGARDHTITVLNNPTQRLPFSFLRLGLHKITFTRTYLSGFFKRKRAFINPNTSLHGETRPIIDTEIYNSVMPMRIPVVPLIKALITKNFDLACELGFLEICPEDFSLPTLIDPSKTEMFSIVKEALTTYAKESGIFSQHEVL